jgi:segregation and condensation protein A
MDIYEIDIRVIIEEYLEFINALKNKNIDIASSYLVMASELIHLKSKMLVNDDTVDENNNDEFHIDSEEDLKRKIIEYEKYKKLTESLEEQRLKRSNFYTKSPSKLDEIMGSLPVCFGNVSINDLVNALQNVKNREKLMKPLNTKITKREYSIEKRINDIRNILKVRKKVEFLELFDENNRDFLIVTFLSILTMSKNEEILLNQEDNFKPITIEVREVHE